MPEDIFSKVRNFFHVWWLDGNGRNLAVPGSHPATPHPAANHVIAVPGLVATWDAFKGTV